MVHHKLFLGLGGNTGNKHTTFSETLRLISDKVGNLVTISPLFATPPWGFESSDIFWNMVVQVDTLHSPEEVLHSVEEIEKRFGRVRKPGVYLSRQMDIDILLFDQMILDSTKLTIPHPLMTSRRFVLEPLARIAPEVVHPTTGNTIRELLIRCKDDAQITEISDGSELMVNQR